MKPYTLLLPGGKTLPLRKAQGSRERRAGLLSFSEPPAWGLLLNYCPSIHMVGMKFAIDLVFLRRGRVVALYPSLRPGMRIRAALATDALELPEGTVERLSISKGQRLGVRAS